MQRVVVVCGSTGVGKSDLAIHLAKSLNGEIINADIMQTYRGLDLVTNKSATFGIPHHLLGCQALNKEYIVSDWVKGATRIITEISSRGNVPVIVGGSHYYIQSLLFTASLVSQDAKLNCIPVPRDIQQLLDSSEASAFAALNSPDRLKLSHQMHAALTRIDPEMAQKWHPNNDRKIRRSIQVYYETGRKHSEFHKESQHDTARFKTLLFWLYADVDKLDSKLDARVDKMIERGLFEELVEMRKLCDQGKVVGVEGSDIDFSRGILQTIGFKEFNEYLSMTFEAPSTPEQQKLFYSCVELMKISTRQYARRQLTWLRNKLFAKSIASSDVNAYILDATDPTQRSKLVNGPALSLTSAFIAGSPLPGPEEVFPEYRSIAKEPLVQEWKAFTCAVCKVKKPKGQSPKDASKDEFRVFYGEKEWTVHLKSRAHLNNLRKV